MRRRYLCSDEEKIDLSKPYFAIEALEDDLQVNFSNNYEYCIDNGVWKKANSITKIRANASQTLYFRTNFKPKDYTGIGTFTISGKCNLSGNIMSLLFGDYFEGQTDLTDYDNAFRGLFYNCDIIDASQLILPATTLTDYCYYSMFQECTSLTAAPVLPATTLTTGCYAYMFKECTSLTAVPKLPATTLGVLCYTNMFENCSSIVTAPELPATTLVDSCYYGMFYGCTKLNYIKALFTTTPSSLYTNNWVYRVSRTGTFVKSKDATWNVTGVDGIPERWTVQTA